MKTVLPEIPKIADPYMLSLVPSSRGYGSGFFIKESDGKIAEIVLDVVANAFALSVEELKGRPRRSNSARILARQIAVFLIWKTSGMSLPQMARVLGWKNHTSVMYARNKITALIDTSPMHAEAVARAEAEVRAALT